MSDIVFQLRSQDPIIHQVHFYDIEFDSILLSLLNILNGNSFIYLPPELNYVQSSIDLIDISSFSGKILIPATFQEAIFLLSNVIFIHFRQQFEHSCHLVSENFSQITSSDFGKLTHKSLERILSLDALRLPCENFLLQKIIETPRKMHLLKFVVFPAVEYQLLIQFIQNLDLTEIDIDSFDSLKKFFIFLMKTLQ
jgi:hypothetical protein